MFRIWVFIHSMHIELSWFLAIYHFISHGLPEVYNTETCNNYCNPVLKQFELLISLKYAVCVRWKIKKYQYIILIKNNQLKKKKIESRHTTYWNIYALLIIMIYDEWKMKNVYNLYYKIGNLSVYCFLWFTLWLTIHSVHFLYLVR